MDFDTETMIAFGVGVAVGVWVIPRVRSYIRARSEAV